MIGESITLSRKQAGLSMAELARRAELSRSYLHAIENGEIENPSFNAVMRLAFELKANPLDWWQTPDGTVWTLYAALIKSKELIDMAYSIVKSEEINSF